MRLPRFLKPRPEVHVGALEFDDWEVVEDYEDLETAWRSATACATSASPRN